MSLSALVFLTVMFLVIGVDFEQGGCTLIIDKKFVWRWTSGQLFSRLSPSRSCNHKKNGPMKDNEGGDRTPAEADSFL